MADATGTTTLPDGRVLAWHEYGDPDGRPVVNCHGGLVCGLDAAPLHVTARALGLRLISPDRPGVDRSTPSPGRTLREAARDVAALLDRLGIAQAAAYGWSMGGAYALACARFLPERITRTVVVAGCLPLDDPDVFSELNATDRHLTRLSHCRPAVAAATFRAMGVLARHAPAVWTTLTRQAASPAASAELPASTHTALAAAAAAALRGGDGMVEEYRAWTRPWGFGLDEVPGEVVLWRGTGDAVVPPPWAERFARIIPHARLREVDGGGHFIAYTHPVEILASLAE